MSVEDSHYEAEIAAEKRFSISAEDVAAVRQALYDAKFAMSQDLTPEDFALTLERITDALDRTSKWK